MRRLFRGLLSSLQLRRLHATAAWRSVSVDARRAHESAMKQDKSSCDDWLYGGANYDYGENEENVNFDYGDDENNGSMNHDHGEENDNFDCGDENGNSYDGRDTQNHKATDHLKHENLSSHEPDRES